ncbi:MAG: hypothetical protein LDL41_03375 [Coleofasciculus sp. S288]|nr:hypothetical protein [Coleofasciculus sp. S288]
MNRLITWVKSIRLDRILTVFFFCFLLFVTTACSGKVSAKTADGVRTADQIRQEVPEGAVTSPYKGGMNDYSDVDPRQSTSAAEAKAKGLLDKTERNLEKRVDSREQYVENYREGAPLGERVRRLGENVGEAAENVRKEAAKGAQENAQNAKQAANRTADAAQSKVKSDIETTKQAAQDAGDTVKSKVNRDISRTQRALDDAADKAADALD